MYLSYAPIILSMRLSYFLLLIFYVAANSLKAQHAFIPMSEKEQRHLIEQLQILNPSDKWLVSDDAYILFDTLSTLDYDTLGYIASLDSAAAATIEDCGYGYNPMERDVEDVYFDALMDNQNFADTLRLHQERLGSVIFDSAWYARGKTDSLSMVYFNFPRMEYKILQATSGDKVYLRVRLDYRYTIMYEDYMLIKNQEGGYTVVWEKKVSECHLYTSRITYKNKRAYRRAQRKEKREKKRKKRYR